MLSSIKLLEHCQLRAGHGVVGTVADTYFDGSHWVARYLVAALGSWLHERKVLLLPDGMRSFDWPSRAIAVGLSRAHIRPCPSIDRHKLVSRQHKHDFQWYEGNHYGYAGSGAGLL
jgi:hypothetical protein